MRRNDHGHRRRGLAAVITCACLLAGSASAQAQSAGRRIDVLGFDPAVGPNGILSVESTRTLAHLRWAVGASFSYVNDPLVVSYNGDTVYRLVGHQLLMDLTAAMGIWRLFEVGLHLPAALYQSGGAPTTVFGDQAAGLSASALGDLRVVPKVRFWSNRKNGFGVSLMPVFTLPTGRRDANAGETATFDPRVAVDYRFRQGTVLAFNLGYRLRGAREMLNLRVDDEIFFGLGAEVPVWRNRLSVLGEVNGSIGVGGDAATDPDAGIDEEEAPLEALIGVRYRLGFGLAVTVGGGVGITNGWSTPVFRVFFGVTYAAPDLIGQWQKRRRREAARLDRDGDTIPDQKDKCPGEAEDKDGFQDDDGCPDPDNDSDGVCDPNAEIQRNLIKFSAVCKGKDQAPLDPEDRDGFQDEDGIPEPDNDGDKVCDPHPVIQKQRARFAKVCKGKDQAPMAPEDRDGYQDEDGIPDPDNDGDGFCDPNPTIQKNLSRYEKVCRWKEICPDAAEDKDGFQDEDGCPDPDNDLDGVCDDNASIQGRLAQFKDYCSGKDKCPTDPETINGVDDEDGCPDKGKVLITVSRRSIKLLEKVSFHLKGAGIKKRSHKLLDVLAATLKRNRWITKLRIEAHTANKSKDDRYLNWSLAQAGSVRKVLIKKGIKSERLIAMGFGGSRPLKHGCNRKRNARARRKCRNANERIELIVIEVNSLLQNQKLKRELLEGIFE